MRNWTEIHIGVVYYIGLLISLLASVIVIYYLSPIKSSLNKIVMRFEKSWSHGFKSSVVLAGLLGAMSVSFKDCSGKYDYLLHSPTKTVLKGLEQVSSAFGYLAIILGLWLVVFILLRMTMLKKNM